MLTVCPVTCAVNLVQTLESVLESVSAEDESFDWISSPPRLYLTVAANRTELKIRLLESSWATLLEADGSRIGVECHSVVGQTGRAET